MPGPTVVWCVFQCPVCQVRSPLRVSVPLAHMRSDVGPIPCHSVTHSAAPVRCFVLCARAGVSCAALACFQYPSAAELDPHCDIAFPGNPRSEWSWLLAVPAPCSGAQWCILGGCSCDTAHGCCGGLLRHAAPHSCVYSPGFSTRHHSLLQTSENAEVCAA